MRKSFPILALGTLILLAGCARGSSTTATGSGANSNPNTSAAASTPNSTPSSNNDSTPTPAPTPTPLPVIENYKTAIVNLFKTARDGDNYTYTIITNPGSFTNRFTKNAYQVIPNTGSQDDLKDYKSYVANSTGVFEFGYDASGAITATSDYLKHPTTGNNYTNIYDLEVRLAYGEYDIDEGSYCKPVRSLKVIEETPNAYPNNNNPTPPNIVFNEDLLVGADVTANRYQVPNRVLATLFPGQMIARLTPVYVSLGRDQKSLVFSQAGFNNTSYSLTVSDIGTTTIEGIEEFINNGGSPSIAFSSPLTTVLHAQNYTIYNDADPDTPFIYVNPKYTFNTTTNTGYANITSGLDDSGLYNISKAAGGDTYTLGTYTGSTSFYNTVLSIYGIIKEDIIASFTPDASNENEYNLTGFVNIRTLHLHDLLGYTGSPSTAKITLTMDEETLISANISVTTTGTGAGTFSYTIKNFGETTVQGIETLINGFTY